MYKEGQISMRKTALVLSLGAVCVAILSGCKKRSKYVVPTTPFEKVSVALSGVEKSFSNYKSSEKKTSSSSKTRSIKRTTSGDVPGALADIASLYYTEDSQGDKIDELEYDQPPMIQFQCLKRGFESIGSSYSFGTKYYDTINGVVYFDPSTGESKKDSQEAGYKFDYALTLSFALNIDSNDLINADVAFKIDLSQGSTHLETNWYVSMVLDYEMSKESPTYTLIMYTDNEESDLDYLEHGFTYEYDYVDMKEGRINEWRKFCYETNKRMVKDNSHETFESYLSDSNFKVQIAASKWYKNADLRKISHARTSIAKKFGAALFNKLGLNTTDINGAAFVAKEGTQNAVIKNIYSDFSKLFKQDVIYNLVADNENREKVKANIRVMDFNVKNEITHITIEEDTTFRELFNCEPGNYGVWYFDKNDNELEAAENLDLINFSFSIPYGTSGQTKSYGNECLDEKISTLYEKLGKENYLVRNTTAIINISEGLLNTYVLITIGEEINQIINLYFKGFFPSELETLGFSVYDEEEALFTYSDDIQMVLDIENTTLAELNAYKAKLENLNWSKQTTQERTNYTKLNGSTLLTVSIVENATSISGGKVRIFYSVETVQNVAWPRDEIKTVSGNIFDLTEPVSKNGYFVVDQTLENTVILKNFTEQERNSFISSLEACGAKLQGESTNLINVVSANRIYRFSLVVGEDITFTYKAADENIFPVYELTLQKDGADVTQIALNEDLNIYTLTRTLEPGVYKVNKHNLFDNSVADVYMPMEGFDAAVFAGKLEYSEKELTVIEEVSLVFNMSIDNAEFITLQSGN